MNVNVLGNRVFYSSGTPQPSANPERSIVFVHGAGMDHSVWVMPARYFARHGWQVIAPDLPAHGQSGGTALTSIAAMRDWVFALQDALAIRSSVVVGHSMGSLIGFACAASSASRVSRLALLGTSAPMPVSAGLLDAAADNHPAALAMANIWSHSASGKLGRSGHPGSWNLHTGLRLLERCADTVFHADLAACNSFDAADFGAVDSTPTLLIAGAADQMTPARAGLAVAKNISGCETRVLPGCGHSMLSEQPNAVLDALSAFLTAAG